MKVLMFIFAVFALLGACDCIFGSKFKIGKEFEKGIMSLGPLALSMVGMICISPVLAKLLLPLINPFAELCHFDSSVIIGSILANDMGGAPLAVEIAGNEFWGYFNGLIVGGMLGVTVSFTIPVALKTVKEEYHSDVLLGILCGICTIPVGCFISGIILGADLIELLLNLVPVIIISALVAFGILRFPKTTVKVFSIFGKIIAAIISLGLGCGIFESLTGIVIIPGMLPISDAFATVSGIAIVLAGVFPLIFVVSKILSKPLMMVGKFLGISGDSVLGFISSLANSIPVFEKSSDMDRKGRILNFAFAVSAAFVFGDHLAFCTAFNADFALAMIIGKLSAGISAVAVASIICSKSSNITN